MKTIVSTASPNQYKEAMGRLVSLAGILDQMGQTTDADYIDQITKEAAGIWDFLFSGLGGAATTKDQGGNSILDAIKGGNVGQFFNKDTIVRMITNFLVGGGIGLVADELVEVLTQKVPILKWFGDSKFIKVAITTALTAAVVHSDFVEQIVNSLVDQFEQVVGMKKPEVQPQQATPPAQPQQPAANTNTTTTPAQVNNAWDKNDYVVWERRIPGVKGKMDIGELLLRLKRVDQLLEDLGEWYEKLNEYDEDGGDIEQDPRYQKLMDEREKLVIIIRDLDPQFGNLRSDENEVEPVETMRNNK